MNRKEEMESALKYYAEQYCEGWCKDNHPDAMFNDCGGCRARAALRASAAPEEGTIVLTPPTLDQQEYLDKIKRETGKYDPNFLVTGPKKGAALPSDSGKAALVAWRYRFDDKWNWEYRDNKLSMKDLVRQENGFEEQPLYAALAPATEGGGREEIVRSLLLQNVGSCFDGLWEGPMLLPEKVKALAQKITNAIYPSPSARAKTQSKEEK